MTNLRRGQAGEPLNGENVGDLLVWDGEEWVPGSPPAGMSAFDFVLSSRDDLAAVVAPVAGVFLLPTGSYAIKAAFALDPGESLAVEAGEIVYIQGMGASKVISGEPAAGSGSLLEVRADAFVALFGLQLLALDGACIAQSGLLSTNTCVIQAVAGGGIDVTGGDWKDFSSVVVGETFGVRHTTGIAAGVFTEIVGVAGPGYQNDGIAAGTCDFVGVFFLSQTEEAIRLANTGGDNRFHLGSCQTLAGTGAAVDIVAASTLHMSGMMVTGTGSEDGVRFDGPVTGGVQILGITLDELDDGIRYESSVQRRVVIANCNSTTSCAVGVDWDSANIPTLGLLEVGCTFDTADPFQNHSQSDPGVNRKACCAQGGLTSETAII